MGLSEMCLGFKAGEPPGCVRALCEALAVSDLGGAGPEPHLSAKRRRQRQKALFGGAVGLGWSLSGVCGGETGNSGQERMGQKWADFQGDSGADRG